MPALVSGSYDPFRDQIWQFIGAVIGLLALAAVFIAPRLQRSKKALTYEVLSATGLIGHHAPGTGRVEVRFADKILRDPGVFVVKFTNTGTEPIQANDF